LFAWSYPRAAERVLPDATVRAGSALGDDDVAARASWLRRQPCPWMKDLADELDDAADDSLRLLAVDQALAGVEHELTRRKLFPGRAVWMAAMGSVMMAVLAYLLGQLDALPLVLPLGLVAVALCVTAKHRGDRLVERQRASIDALAAKLVFGLDGELPRRRSRKFRRR
jgi:hypothetical protein